MTKLLSCFRLYNVGVALYQRAEQSKNAEWYQKGCRLLQRSCELLEKGATLAKQAKVAFADQDKLADRYKLIARCKLLSNDISVRRNLHWEIDQNPDFSSFGYEYARLAQW